MFCAGCQVTDRLDITAQFVGDNHPRLATLCDQLCHKALSCFGVAACLNQNIKDVTIGIDSPPKPVLHAANRDHDLIQMPLVVWARALPPDTGGKMRSKPINPKPDGFAADDDAAFRQKIFNIRRTERKAIAFQARH